MNAISRAWVLGGSRAENRSVSQQKEANLIYLRVLSTCSNTKKTRAVSPKSGSTVYSMIHHNYNI